MIQAAVAGVTALAMLVPATPPDAGPVPPPTDPATVQVRLANGSGCPSPGPYNTVWFANNTELAFYYDFRFNARAGGSALITARRKNCRMILDITPPDGYTYAITAVEHEGFGYLAPGASASWQAIHYFEGDPKPVPVVHTFVGVEDFWSAVDEVDPNALEWAPCDTPRSLVIDGRLDIDLGTSDPAIDQFMTMDWVDIQPNRYDVAWRPC